MGRLTALSRLKPPSNHIGNDPVKQSSPLAPREQPQRPETLTVHKLQWCRVQATAL